jgi:hypothetical protein
MRYAVAVTDLVDNKNVVHIVDAESELEAMGKSMGKRLLNGDVSAWNSPEQFAEELLDFNVIISMPVLIKRRPIEIFKV